MTRLRSFLAQVPEAVLADYIAYGFFLSFASRASNYDPETAMELHRVFSRKLNFWRGR